MKTGFVILASSAAMLVTGCERQNTKLASPVQQASTNQPVDAGLTLQNKLRKELGLKIIKENWFLYQAQGDQEDWKANKDGFLDKVVFMDGARRITSEEDYYYSGNEFTDLEGHGWERVAVHYDFGTRQIYLAYTGTNKITEAALSKYNMTIESPSSDIAGAMSAVKKVATKWPNPPAE